MERASKRKWIGLAGIGLVCGVLSLAVWLFRPREGKGAVSCDPLYQFSVEEIRARIDETYPKMLELNEANKARFVWDEYGSPEQLGKVRMRAMHLFLEDFEEGKEQGRYILGELPCLLFPSDDFDLALCSHFLFTYSEQFSAEFHIASMMEMARVAEEVRVFPLLTAFSGELSPHLSTVMETLRNRGYGVDVRQVEYEFQKGGNRMLVVSRQDKKGIK